MNNTEIAKELREMSATRFLTPKERRNILAAADIVEKVDGLEAENERLLMDLNRETRGEYTTQAMECDTLAAQLAEMREALRKIANHQWNCTHAQIAQEALAKKGK